MTRARLLIKFQSAYPSLRTDTWYPARPAEDGIEGLWLEVPTGDRDERYVYGPHFELAP